MSRYNVPAIPLDALEAAVDLGNDIAALQINDTDWDDVLAGLREEISKLSVEELESIEYAVAHEETPDFVDNKIFRLGKYFFERYQSMNPETPFHAMLRYIFSEELNDAAEDDLALPM